MQIDPATGERVPDASSAPKIDPATGERIAEASPAAPKPSLMQQGLHNLREGITGPEGVVEFGKGAAKGALSTLTNIDNMASRVPGLRTLVDPNKIADMQQKAQTHSPTQAIGKGAEQAAEFLVPGAGEDAAAAHLGGGLLARVGTKAIGSGLVNKAQGGSFGAGAAMGAAGEGLASGIKAAAPVIAEKSLGITKLDRAFGKTPGSAIINETSGVRPGTIAASAQNRIGQLTPEIESMAAAHPSRVDISPAVHSVDKDIATTVERNNASGRDALFPVRSQLTKNASTGLPLAPQQSATGTLNLKRGLRDQFVKNWNPDAASLLTRDSARKASGVLDQQLDTALGPEFARTNQRISSLIPVADRAASTDLNDSILARTLHKVGRPTGALLGGAAGAAEGRREGGTPGMIAGGLTGLIAPEIITNPTTMMVGARMAASRSVPGLLKGTGGAVLQATRKKDQ